jgi:hypothetical protein
MSSIPAAIVITTTASNANAATIAITAIVVVAAVDIVVFHAISSSPSDRSTVPLKR